MNTDVASAPPEAIITFNEIEDPDLWVKPDLPKQDIEIADYDERWPDHYQTLANEIRSSLGEDVLFLQHIGSTSVPGLAAKPVIDIDLVVADPRDEASYVEPLREIDYELVIREPNWHQHRALRHSNPETDEAVEPRSNLHIFGPNCPEVARHRLFRDWLRAHPEDRELYMSAKRSAAADSNQAGETVMEYNARKQQVIRDIYHRIFVSKGWR